jgi:hypothetical protein
VSRESSGVSTSQNPCCQKYSRSERIKSARNRKRSRVAVGCQTCSIVIASTPGIQLHHLDIKLAECFVFAVTKFVAPKDNSLSFQKELSHFKKKRREPLQLTPF